MENVRGASAPDPDSRYGVQPNVQPSANNPLDSVENGLIVDQLEDWWIESREKHSESRAERTIDHEYYDHEQISPEDRAVYEARNQAPLTYNLVHSAIDWLSGTERRTRVDYKILPRGPEDDKGAKAQSQLMKYVEDANRASWHRSKAFKDTLTSGVGFIEDYLSSDKRAEKVGFGYQDWRFIWWDPYSRDDTWKDCRYVHRVKFLDLDWSIAMFPDRAADLRAVSVAYLDNDIELLDQMDGIPAMFALAGDRAPMRSRGMSGILRDRTTRRRVRVCETYYRRPEVTKEVHSLVAEYADLNGVTFEATNGEQIDLLDRGVITLTDALSTNMHVALWVPGVGMCEHKRSPYSHNEFPWTPIWCYRHHRDGMPYGFVRGMRDPQDEYNKRRGKALFAASVNRVLYEADAFDEDDERESLDEISKPNGEVKVAAGALRDKKIEIQTGIEVAAAHIQFMEQAKDHIFEGNGITRENLGQETGALSGRAIVAKQQQGAVTTAEPFDNLRMAHQLSGEKRLENIRIGMTVPKQIRIVGGNEGMEWLDINKPRWDHEAGGVVWENDILNTKADYVVSAQDFRETLRMAMAESLLETIGKLPPEVAVRLIPFALELTDLPNKDEVLLELRKLSGQVASPPDPAAQAQAAADQQAAAETQRLANEGAAAKIDKDRAGAEKLRADAKAKVIEGKGKALDTAALVHGAVPLAMTADQLYAGATTTPPEPVPAGVVTQ